MPRVLPAGRTTDTRATPRPDRWWRRVRPGDKLTCPRGHELPFPMQRAQRGLFRCERVRPADPPGTPPCGCWLYLAAAVEIGTFSIAVDAGEVQAVDLCRTPDEVFTLLDVWPG